MKPGAAPEIDRYTPKLSELPPSHGRQFARHELSWSYKPPSRLLTQAAQIALVMHIHSQCIAIATLHRRLRLIIRRLIMHKADNYRGFVAVYWVSLAFLLCRRAGGVIIFLMPTVLRHYVSSPPSSMLHVAYLVVT